MIDIMICALVIYAMAVAALWRVEE